MTLGLRPFIGKALEAYRAPLARINIWDGAVRSGKTINSLVRWARWVQEDAPPGLLMMVGKTERTVKQNVIAPLQEMFGERHARFSAGNHELVLFGRRHLIIGAADERAEGKIRGVTLAGCYGDEITLWPESFFTMLMSRMSVEGAALVGTTNPDSPAHWLNREYLQRADELNLRRWVFRLYDNPNLAPDFVRALEMEFVGLWRKRFIEGLWVVAEGAVYDMLDDVRHTSMERPSGVRWRVVGGDYGTTNPTVFAAMSMLEDGTFLVHDEWRHDPKIAGASMTMPELSKGFRDWIEPMSPKPDRAYVDPSANALILQIWRDGYRKVAPADNDVLAGIMETSALLYNGMLRFHVPTTRLLFEEFASYAWDPDATLKGEDKPLKVADHGPDAVRYGVRGSRSRWRPILRERLDAAA